MSKAVGEVAIGAALIGASFAMPGIGMALTWMTASMQGGIISSMVGLGSSFVMTGIADALHVQPGLAVGVASPIAPWGYIYGRQKVGGVLIFDEENSSQGTSNNKELHRVYCLACHPCSIGAWQLRLDGNAVNMQLSTSGAGWDSYSPGQFQRNITSVSRTNGVVTMVLDSAMPNNTDGTTLQIRSVRDGSFNGTWTVTQPNPGDLTTWTYICGGANTSSSGGVARTVFFDYGNKVHVEILDGTHTSTFPGLLASGTSWGVNDLCLGKTVAYIRMGYDAAVFPQGPPQISWVIDGKKDILIPGSNPDVSTWIRGYTPNAVLCIADYLSIAPIKGGFGLTIGTDIPAVQLSAAATTCGEPILLNAGGTTPRYTCNTYFQLLQTRGTILKNMLSSCAGRITYQGGTYFIVPGVSAASVLTLTAADFVGGITSHPRLSIRDTANAVKGVYVSPENNYQQSDVPPYMVDADHGFTTDPWLAEDNGERIFVEGNFPCTDSSAIAQRLEKIALLRLRYQYRCTVRCSLRAYQATALDVVQITYPRYTWLNKAFEVLSARLGFDKTGEAPLPFFELDLAETDSSIYDWNPIEQLTPQGYVQPNNVGNRICNPPEDITGYSGPGEVVNGITYPSTFTTGADGRITNSIYIRWNSPNDANVVSGGHIEASYQPTSASVWTGLSKVDPSINHVYVPNVNDGEEYNLQVRAVNNAGVPSEWVVVGPITVTSATSTLVGSSTPVAPAGTLTTQGMSDGTAHITVYPFTARVGASVATCTPSPNVLTGLNQAQLYYVYYSDPSFAGGTITPIATQNALTFEGITGNFLINSIVTATYVPRYQPTRYTDIGSTSTTTAAGAYDNDVSTGAVVGCVWWSLGAHMGPPPEPQFSYQSSLGECMWSGFPPVTISSPLTLHVIVSGSSFATPTYSTWVTVTIGSVTSTLLTLSSPTAQADYTMTIPAGTNLSTISLTGWANISLPPPGNSSGGGTISMRLVEIYIQ